MLCLILSIININSYNNYFHEVPDYIHHWLKNTSENNESRLYDSAKCY